MNGIYSIQYDLLTPGRDYSRLIPAIQNLGETWAKPLESCFLIKTHLTAAQIRDQLITLIDQNDKLFVLEPGKNWASLNLHPDVVKWLNRNVG